MSNHLSCALFTSVKSPVVRRTKEVDSIAIETWRQRVTLDDCMHGHPRRPSVVIRATCDGLSNTEIYPEHTYV